MGLNFEIEAFLPKEKELLKGLGLDENGRVQEIIDYSYIHYLKLKMPYQSGVMMSNTIRTKPGEIVVNVPYAHYMNEGILYVMPESNKSAMHNSTTGRFSSKRGRKVPTNRQLKYHGGAGRGAHFVERTTLENFNDILKEVQNEVNKR